jgi:hypothetical protein
LAAAIDKIQQRSISKERLAQTLYAVIAANRAFQSKNSVAIFTLV